MNTAVAAIKDDNEDEKSTEVPYNLEAEQALLGSFLNNNETVNQVADFLLPDYFYMPFHKQLFASILKTIDRGSIATPITLQNYFNKEEIKEQLGVEPFQYMVNMSASAATVINIKSFATEVYEMAMRRSLIELGQEVVTDAYQESLDKKAQDRIEEVEQKLFNLASLGDLERGFIPMRESFMGMLNKIRIDSEKQASFSGVPMGFIELDKLLGGMQNSDLLILAARPSMGKTGLAINVAMNAAKFFIEDFKKTKGNDKMKSVGVFSLEMSSEQVANRMLASATGIDSSKIRLAQVSKDDIENISSKCHDLCNLPIFVDDTPALTISAVRTRARRLKRQHNLGLLIIDYLQLLQGVGKFKEGNRVQEIGQISQGLKAIAKELDIPVIALSQLSRAVENREDKRPQLSDLRESGNIEQDADVVMFIYRESYYLERKRPLGEDDAKLAEWEEKHDKVKNIAEIIVSKQRNGPIGNRCLRFESSIISFSSLEKGQYHN